MGKRTGNKPGPTKNKGPKNRDRKETMYRLERARLDENETLFGKLINKLRSM